MPRSPVEATRFTATGPHASSKSSTVSTIDIAGPPNPNETPAQKVARLREAARRARMDQETTWDRIVLRGRVWADRAHRVTTTALILSGIVAAGFATLSLGEMVVVNRGKKADWIKEQESNYQKGLALARKAEAEGTLTDSLRMFLNKERALEQAEAEKATTPSTWARLKHTLFGGLALEEQPRARPRGRLMVDPETLQGRFGKEGEVGVPTTRGELTAQQSAEEVARAEEPSEIRAANDIRSQLAPSSRVVGTIRGGPLDRFAEETSSAIAASSRRWFGLSGSR